MLVTHRNGKKSISKEIENPTFILSNSLGGYVSFSNRPLSKYQGLYLFKNEKMIKVIENISISKKQIELINEFHTIKQVFKGNKSKITLPKGLNALLYELESKDDVTIEFDVRESYNLVKWGRHFSIELLDDIILITYNDQNMEFYVAIKADTRKYLLEDKWVKKTYEYDKKRGTDQYELYVYKGITIHTKKLAIAYGFNKEKVTYTAKSTYQNSETIKLENSKKISEKLTSSNKNIMEKNTINTSILRSNTLKNLISFNKKSINKKYELAFEGALNSLNGLILDIPENEAILAGYYHFFQVWTRDEAISTGALISLGRYKEAKNILFRELRHIQDDGRIPNRFPASKLATADGIGWTCKRIYDLIMVLKANNRLKEFFTDNDLQVLQHDVKFIVERLLMFHTHDDFEINDRQETWMDTVYHNDTREGVRIEIQALRLKTYKLLELLSRLTFDFQTQNLAQKLLINLKEKVVDYFFNGNILADGMNDYTIRPNIFLACYIYPELMMVDQWIKCIDNSLPKLWCDWGGLSTIDKNNPLYCNTHTGEDDRSYHRGDSWFFINNIAAIVMYKLDRRKFSKYISKIIDSSAEDILFFGSIGSASEISSAGKLEAFGCFSQAWSNSTFIELFYEQFAY